MSTRTAGRAPANAYADLMRATPVLLLVAAFLMAGCASDSTEEEPDLGPLADQADRVAHLIDEERPCEAVEATRTLASLADDDRMSEQVTEAVTSFAASVESSIECPPATSEPTSDPPPPPPPDDDGQDDDDRDDVGEDDDQGGGDDKDDDQGGGDDKDDDEHPGEGKAKGKNGNPGRGNDDD